MSDYKMRVLVNMEIKERQERQLHILADDYMDKIQQGREWLRLNKEINFLNMTYRKQNGIVFLILQ